MTRLAKSQRTNPFGRPIPPKDGSFWCLAHIIIKEEGTRELNNVRTAYCSISEAADVVRVKCCATVALFVPVCLVRRETYHIVFLDTHPEIIWLICLLFH